MNYKINFVYLCAILLLLLLIVYLSYESFLFLASPYGKTKRQRWTEKEKADVLEAFAHHMENLTLPSLKEIQHVKKKYSSLMNRTSPQIKTWIYNTQKILRNEEFI